MAFECVLSHSVVSDSLRPHGLQPARLLCPWRFSRQEYWSELPFSSPGNLPNPEIEPKSPALAGGFFTTESLNGFQGKVSPDWLMVR